MNDSDDTAFDLNSWMAEESQSDPSQQPLPGGYVRQRTQDIGTDPDAVLNAMRSAAEGGDPERVINLGRAVLGMVPENERQPIRELMDQAAIRLVNRYIPRRLETAHVWATSWAAFSINPRAKEYERELRERVNQVKQREATIAAHIAGGNLGALAGALRELGQDADRCQGTDEVIRQGEQALQRRGEQLQRAKAELAQVVPGNLDRAVELMTLIYNEEPNRNNQEHLTALNTRLHQARQRLEAARQALQRRLLPDVERGLALMRESADRTVGSTECLAQLQSLHADLAATRTERLDDYTAFLKQRDLTKAIRVLQDIRDIDPQHPELAKIADLKKRQKRLVQLHARLQEAMDAYDEAEIRQLRNALSREKLQLSASRALLQQAEDTLEQIAARRRRQRRSTVLAITIVLILVAIPAAWYQWETQAFNAALTTEGEAARRQALQAYLDDPYHKLYRQKAEAKLQEMASDKIKERWLAIDDEADREQRSALAAAFIADFQSQTAGNPKIAKWIEKAEALQRNARDLRDQEAYDRALHTEGDYQQRIAALQAYRQRPDAQHAVQAQAAIERLRQQEDSEAWTSANANGDLAERIAGLEAYLAGDGRRQHRQEAERSLADLRRRQQQLDQRNSDAEAWRAVTTVEDPADRLAAVMTYLERPEPRHHQVEAQHLRQRLEKELDDARFQQAITIEDPLERHRALERFLADNADSPHRADAELARNAALRAYDDQRYAAAIGPGTAKERLRRLQAYLQSKHQRFHDEDVETEITAVSKELDFAALSRARSQQDPLVRLLALDAFRARAEALPEHLRLAKEASEQALQQIAAFPPADIAPLPGEVLDRLPVSILSGLPLASLTRLSTATLLRLPAESFARFGDQELARFPRIVRRQVHYHPSWAADSGVDEQGPWADLRVDDDLHLRFRRLVAGTLTESEGARTIQLDQDCWLGESELAQVVWELILGRRHNPSATEGPRLPVHGVGPDQLDEALERLRRRVRRAAGSEALRLPRLAELRLAAYVDRSQPPAIPDTSDDPLDQVGSDPQAWQGFHHLLGNVSEWCRDGDALVLFGGPFPASIDGDVLQTDNAQTRAGLRLAIPAGPDESRGQPAGR